MPSKCSIASGRSQADMFMEPGLALELRVLECQVRWGPLRSFLDKAFSSILEAFGIQGKLEPPSKHLNTLACVSLVQKCRNPSAIAVHRAKC